ncbi:MAG TPA: hypothetical protein VLE27_13130 [Thermoanaerobaculia bacterium]|nr:hypothetical protein [Thermoanaerobaculia bacterium]
MTALLLVACSGGPAERGRAEVEGTGAAPRSDATSSSAAAQPASPSPTSSSSTPQAGPALSYSVLDTQMEGEVPVRWTPVFTGSPRTRLDGGVLWAPAAAVVRVLAPQSRVTLEGGSLKIDGNAVTTSARLENGEPWAAVAPLARHLGAYALVNETDGSVSLWTRDALVWLRDNGDPQAPVLREARAAGLLTDR